MDDKRLDEAEPDSARPKAATASAVRVALRFAACVLALAAVDATVSRFVPAPDFSRDWRMPRALPTSELLPAVEDLESTACDAKSPVVVFLGASPTWGDAVDEARDTVPASFGRAAREGTSSPIVYNLAANGQLVGDGYFIARRVEDDADLLFVQLTYHAFNADWREQERIRYPELPGLLGVPMNADLAAVLDIDPTRRPDVTGMFDRGLRSTWRLYGARDALASRLLGATPEMCAREGWQRLLDPALADAEKDDTGLTPVEELPPDRQMMIIDEFAAAADFRVRTTDSETRMLERLATALAQADTRTIFYMAPINIDALESYEAFDWTRYAENVATLRRIVEAKGHRFHDLNTGLSLPSSAFADISHTTAAGNNLVGAELWRLASAPTGDPL